MHKHMCTHACMHIYPFSLNSIPINLVQSLKHYLLHLIVIAPKTQVWLYLLSVIGSIQNPSKACKKSTTLLRESLFTQSLMVCRNCILSSLYSLVRQLWACNEGKSEKVTSTSLSERYHQSETKAFRRPRLPSRPICWSQLGLLAPVV